MKKTSKMSSNTDISKLKTNEMTDISSSVKPQVNVKSKAKTSQKQAIINLASRNGLEAPDLNDCNDYPVHPNRIWPD